MLDDGLNIYIWCGAKVRQWMLKVLPKSNVFILSISLCFVCVVKEDSSYKSQVSSSLGILRMTFCCCEHSQESDSINGAFSVRHSWNCRMQKIVKHYQKLIIFVNWTQVCLFRLFAEKISKCERKNKAEITMCSGVSMVMCIYFVAYSHISHENHKMVYVICNLVIQCSRVYKK